MRNGRSVSDFDVPEIPSIDDDYGDTGVLDATTPNMQENAAPRLGEDDHSFTPGFEWSEADVRRFESEGDDSLTLPRYHPSRYAVREERRGVSRLRAVLSAVLAVGVVVGIVYVVLYFVRGDGINLLNAVIEESPRTTTVVTGKEAIIVGSDQELTVPLWVPWLDKDGSRVPVRVSGKKLDGGKVDEQLYLTHDGKGLMLPPGGYKLHVLGSPISSDGVVYEVGDQTLQITIGADGTCTYGTNTPTLTPIDATKVTDEQIEEARQWALEDDECADRADDLAQAARDRRETVANAQVQQMINARRRAEEQANKKAEEDSKKKAEEEEAKKKAEEEEAKKKAEEAKKNSATEGEGQKKPDPEPTPTPEPEPDPTPEPEPDPTPDSEPTPTPEPESTPDSTPESGTPEAVEGTEGGE